jgi:hypothetical protein
MLKAHTEKSSVAGTDYYIFKSEVCIVNGTHRGTVFGSKYVCSSVNIDKRR